MRESIPSRGNSMCKGIERGTEWNVLGRSRSSVRLDIRVPEGGEGAPELPGEVGCIALECQAKEPGLYPKGHEESRRTVSEVGTPPDTWPPGSAFVTQLLLVSMEGWGLAG